MKKKKETTITLMMNAISILIAAIALFFAWQANRISQSSISPTISIVKGERSSEQTQVFLYGCEYARPGYAVINYFTQEFIYITNTGGQASSIVFIHIPSTKHSWKVDVYDTSDEIIRLPTSIQPGETKLLHLVASAPARYASLENISLESPNSDYPAYSISEFIKWEVELNDGTELIHDNSINENAIQYLWTNLGIHYNTDCEKAQEYLIARISSK